MPKVFISSKLEPVDPFRIAFQEAGIDLIDASLLLLSRIDVKAIPAADWLFFYSKVGVRSLKEQCMERSWTIDMQLAAIGPATAEAMREAGWHPDFIGDGRPESTAADFGNMAKNKRVIFVQASNSRQSVQQLLADQVEAVNLVVYDNQPKADIRLPVCDGLLFTSPMNVNAYFSKYPLLKRQKVAAIGEPTAAALAMNAVADVQLPSSPSIEKLLEMALVWFRKPV